MVVHRTALWILMSASSLMAVAYTLQAAWAAGRGRPLRWRLERYGDAVLTGVGIGLGVAFLVLVAAAVVVRVAPWYR